MKFNFSGYATKNDLQCSDGRTIRKDAFKDNDGQTVPLVWAHQHNTPENILGHAILENREDGVYAYGKFNNTEAGKNAKALVEHGDITALSIFANKLKQKGQEVLHGAIREVSIVMAGANPGAFIDNVAIEHADGTLEDDVTEAVIYTDNGISTEEEDLVIEHKEEVKKDDATVGEIFNTLNDQQKEVVYAMLAHALETQAEELEQSEEETDEDLKHNDEEDDDMKVNVFDKDSNEEVGNATLSHDEMKVIFEDANKMGSLKEAVLKHAGTYGIDNIDLLFPDAKAITSSPDFISRRMEWVQGVIAGTHHTPFSRIKSLTADITVETARAKGYVTGALKKEEVFGLLKRTTTPTTIYKKQKLDRDDIIDIVDLDVVAWLKAEMRVMLDEELARAVLIGDGRDVGDEDKINEENIRPIYKDDDMYSHKVRLEQDVTAVDKIEAIIRARKFYKGTGRPTLFTTAEEVTEMLLAKDTQGRRLYKSEAELASDLRVASIVEVEVMEGTTREDAGVNLNLVGLIVNLKDYKLGADKGGQISMFDDFDIDYNQYKYLIETRVSGALVKPKSALVIEEIVAAG